MTTADHIEKLYSIMERVENKLDAWQETPEEVKQLRAVVDAIRRDERQEREAWRDILYRLLTSLAGLVKPKPKREIENCGNIPPDDHEPK